MLRERSLFERLGGHSLKYASGDERRQRQVESVKNNVQQMLNSRMGSVTALPDFGMPDFNDLVYEFPDAIVQLQEMIKRFLLKYEPRIEAVNVRYLPDNENPLQLRYRVAVSISSDGVYSETVQFNTVITGSGQAFVTAV